MKTPSFFPFSRPSPGIGGLSASRRLGRRAFAGFLLVLAGCADSLSIAVERSAMVGEGIAWFVPEGAGKAVEPSFALEREPAELGPLPDRWKMIPQFSVVEGRSQAVVSVAEGSHLYGTGEVLGTLARNGAKIELWNTDNYKYEVAEGKRLYQSHPWVLGVRKEGTAFGVIFDTTWKATLETGDEKITFASEGPPFRVIIIDRPTPQGVLAGLAELTGRMPLPPRWALGFQQCRYSYYPDARVREIANEFRARRLPCDVIWMDIHYMNAFRVFSFDPQHFPDPSATNAFLHENGFKGVWMIDPGVKAEKGYAVYDSGTRAGIWVQDASGKPFVGPVWPGDCVFPDFTMPKAQSWWADLYGDFMATGIDGVWNDMNEPSVFEKTVGFSIPEDAMHRGGGPLPPGLHRRYHNVYGLLMVRASREGILKARPDRRPFVLTRSNFLGGHRYAATWTGDNTSRWVDLKRSIPMSINLGLSGQPFNGPDIGGFALDADPVLFGHWIALGAQSQSPGRPMAAGGAAIGKP